MKLTSFSPLLSLSALSLLLGSLLLGSLNGFLSMPGEEGVRGAEREERGVEGSRGVMGIADDGIMWTFVGVVTVKRGGRECGAEWWE